jgi:flagellar protein FliS
MAPMQRAMSAYGQAAETLAPARQIVLLYDGAIRRTKEARRAIESRRVNERFIAIEKATAIIEALHACLDYERGGEIARNLDRLYTYVVFRLQRVNLTDDGSICDEVVERLGELRSAWAQIAEGGSAPAALSGPATERPRVRAVAPGTAVTI